MWDALPCPCGSGKPLAECCLTEPVSSIEELQERSRKLFETVNQKKCSDFMGLSPHEVHQSMEQPFDCPELVQWVEVPELCDTPVMKVMFQLIETFGERGLKATAKGNLPLKLSRELAMTLLGESLYDMVFSEKALQTEANCPNVFLLRNAILSAGFIRLRDNKWQITVRCRKYLAMNKPEKMFWPIFREYARTTYWLYGTHLDDEYSIIQMAFIYSLWMLHKSGDKWRDDTYYGLRFLQAFPMVRERVAYPEGFTTDYAQLTYGRMMLTFGFADIQFKCPSRMKVQKARLLDRCVLFQKR